MCDGGISISVFYHLCGSVVYMLWLYKMLDKIMFMNKFFNKTFSEPDLLKDSLYLTLKICVHYQVLALILFC